MKLEVFNSIVEEQIKRSTDLLIKKGVEYATDDRLHNFKVAAVLEHISPQKVLAGFMAKHVVSVYDMIMSDNKYPIEMWNEKITDNINYLLLLRALVEEDKGENGD